MNIMSGEPVVNRRKKLILIRHAESLNNVAKDETRVAWENVKNFRCFPSWEQVSLAGSLLTVPMNTDLSRRGEVMVERLRGRMIDSNFKAEQQIELVVHSHLIRAVRTCTILFGDAEVAIEEHGLVFEKNISEHLGLSDMKRRVSAFMEWLLARPESCIVVVGHSAFFREMLDTDLKMQNCEVRECYITETGEVQDMRTLIEGGQSLLTEV